MITNLLFFFFSIFLIISSLLVVLVQNSVYSALFLILCFIMASSLLFILECEFLALMFIIIYVGAVAVLFLFSIMMLDSKLINLNKDYLKYFPFGFIIGVVFFIEMSVTFLKSFLVNPYNNSFLTNYYFNWFNNVDKFCDIEAVGQILYTKYIVQFLISGFILLLAVLAAATLVVNKTTNKLERKQIIFRQLSRGYNNSII